MENTTIQQIGTLSIKEKQGELLKLIRNITEIQINSLDKKLKIIKPELIEYEFIDLVAEAIFSIRSFCLLMEDGLVSNASAIMRVIIEQITIVSLASSSVEKKEAFLRMKKERNMYYSSGEEYKKTYQTIIAKEKNIKRKVKQYFDYGWYEQNNKPVLDLKSMCEAAGFTEAYNLIEELLNSFSHGQVSIFRFKRNKSNLDKVYVSNLFHLLGVMFFKLCRILMDEYDDDFFEEADIKTIDMAFAISCNLDSYYYESTLIAGINSKELIHIKNLQPNIDLLNGLLRRFNKSNNINERYLLSQTYLRYFKYIFAAVVRSKHYVQNDYTIDSLAMKEVLLKCKPQTIIDEYKRKTNKDINELANFIDSKDDFWCFSSSDNNILMNIDILLKILQDESKNVE